jgi:hypothetical protein
MARKKRSRNAPKYKPVAVLTVFFATDCGNWQGFDALTVGVLGIEYGTKSAMIGQPIAEYTPDITKGGARPADGFYVWNGEAAYDADTGEFLWDCKDAGTLRPACVDDFAQFGYASVENHVSPLRESL